ncbi:MAG: sodium-translocating pyrophosphatase [Calditrichaeota bacterium]|nr:sodium-translocating pyrophosphatase [Calditrichota bacterium]
MDARTLVLAGGAGGIGLVAAWLYDLAVRRQDPGAARVVEIASAIREGAMAFLRREFLWLSFFVVGVAVLLAVFIQPLTGAAFLVGALCSGLSGWLSMRAATRASAPTAQAATQSIGRALRVAFNGGSVLGFTIVGLGALGLVLTLAGLKWALGGDLNGVVNTVAGFSFGASSVALFARVGGGIYTKGADVGADLVGKVEENIPEDDPRNPAVIADNVGDNVGDIAGMGADLFESNIASIVGAMTIGLATYGAAGTALPLLFAGMGIVASLIGSFFVRWKEGKDDTFQQQTHRARMALNTGMWVTVLLVLIGGYFLVRWQIGQVGVYYATVAGIVGGMLIGLSTEYYTSDRNKPVQRIARAAESGAAMNILAGLGVGMLSTAIPILIAAVAIFVAYHFGNVYGLGMVAVGLLASLGAVLSVDGYGPVSDNAAGLAQMADLGEEARRRAEALDSVGNTTAAISKGFAIASAAFTAFALFWAYTQALRAKGVEISMSLQDPNTLIGLFIGGMLPVVFCALALDAVGKAGYEMVKEVRRQFREIPGLRQGTAKPDYRRCVDISTRRALRQMVAPGALAVVAPLVVGLAFGPEALGGLLAGAIVTGFLFAVLMANAGGAWDNAKKYIEAGQFGGKGSAAHKASVVGDTVGDPFKDTAGPSLNILIKLMSIVALVCVPLFV